MPKKRNSKMYLAKPIMVTAFRYSIGHEASLFEFCNKPPADLSKNQYLVHLPDGSYKAYDKALFELLFEEIA